MKRTIFAGLGLLAAVATATAADLPRQSMPYKAPAYVVGYNWSGFYLGVNGGGAWGSSGNLDLSGGFIGGQFGYNWQAPGSNWVFGVEVDNAWADLGRSDTFLFGSSVVSASSNANYMGTFRGRIGYSWDRTMLYATGGLAWLNNEVSINATSGPFTIGVSDSKFHVGGTIGAGIEHAFTPNWSGKIEYLYASYGSETYFANLGGVSLDADVHTIKAGINYHFR